MRIGGYFSAATARRGQLRLGSAATAPWAHRLGYSERYGWSMRRVRLAFTAPRFLTYGLW